MPTLVMASSKGGCGKSTLACVLATELVRGSAAVTLIDADPNQPLMRWAKRPGKPERLTVIGDITEDTLLDTIEAAEGETPFVLVDLEGSANMMVAQAMSRADLVIIPLKGSGLDLAEALKVIRFVKLQERTFRRAIPFTLVFSQTNPAVRSRTLKGIEADLLKGNIPVLATPLHERDAYRAIFSLGGDLHALDPTQVGGLPAAISNARKVMSEVVAKLAAKKLQGAA